MRRRVLIVTSSYAPAMIADMHRARQLAWELPGIGWQVEILSPDGSYQQPSCMDEDGAPFFAPDTITHYVPQFFPGLFRFLGFGSIGWRALLPMLLAGRRLLRVREFDLVYFSTTQFSLFLLGPAWRCFFGVPFVLDFHDPCYKENFVKPALARPSLKHAFSHWLIKHVELLSVTAASGLIAVSPNYIETLRKRYERKQPFWLGEGRLAAIPFPGSARDFDEAARKGVLPAVPAGRYARIVYVGAGGPIMRRAFLLLCKAVAYLREHDPQLVDAVNMDLRGTILGWRNGDVTHLAEIAREQGIADLVQEDPRRLSYRRSIELLLECDAALVLGVDDPGYVPSKFYSYALSGKPLLAAMHRESPVFMQFQSTPGLGHAIWFDQSGEMPVAAAAREVRDFFREATDRMNFDRRAILKSFTARNIARRHADLFEACLDTSVSTPAAPEVNLPTPGASLHGTRAK